MFIGANVPQNPFHNQAIDNLIIALKHHDCHLLYGGAACGAMGKLTNKALDANIQTTGVISHDLLHIEKVHPDIHDSIYTHTISQRKDVMIANSDFFIALPGVLGRWKNSLRLGAQFKLTI